jgi:hypothetical protein
MKIIDLEEGMPTVEQARLRMQYELKATRNEGYTAAKLIHGYGSSGTGGALRLELQRDLRNEVRDGKLRALIPGEDWRISDEATWSLLKRFPEWKRDADLGRNNLGICIVVL